MKLLSTIVALALAIQVDSFAATDPVEEPVEAPIVEPEPVDEPVDAPVVDPGPPCVDGFLEVTCPPPGDLSGNQDLCDGVTCNLNGGVAQWCCSEITFGLCQDRPTC